MHGTIKGGTYNGCLPLSTAIHYSCFPPLAKSFLPNIEVVHIEVEWQTLWDSR